MSKSNNILAKTEKSMDGMPVSLNWHNSCWSLGVVKSSSFFCAAVAGLILLACNISDAANICVGPSSSGNGSGSDWNNLMAWSATPARGDTWYLRDGSYSPKNFNTPVSGTTLITIKKATATDHATDTAWVSTMTNQAVFVGAASPDNMVIEFSTSYWVFDGQTGGGPGSWTNGFGFKIDDSSVALHQMGLGLQAGSYVTVRHFEVVGDGGDGTQTSPNNDGIANNTGTGFFTISYAYDHDLGRCPFIFFGGPVTVEYVYTGWYEYTAGEHSEIMSGSANNITFRYNLFAYVNGTGGLMFDGTGPQYVYGNVFYHAAGVTWNGDSLNGVIGAKSASGDGQPQNINVYNNTFINTSAGIGIPVMGAYMPNYPGNVFSNNLFYGDCDVGSITGTYPLAHDYNYYVAISGYSVPSEAHGTTGTGNPFNNYAILDFTLKANTPAGVNLGSPYNVDFLGNTRTTWTRGALEYFSSTTQEPVISNVQYSAGTNAATITWTTDEIANSIVNYGLTTSYGVSITNSSLVTSHSITLPNLTEGTYYDFQVQSVDSTNRVNSSGNQMFNTVNPAIVLGLHVVSP